MTLDAHQLISLIGVIAGSGVLVSLVANFLKKVLKLKTDAVIHTMVVVIAFVASVAQYIMQIHSKLPPEVLGISTPAIYGLSQVVYKYSIYISGFWGKVQAFNASQSPTQTFNAPAAQTSTVAPGAVFSTSAPVESQLITTGSTNLPSPSPTEFSV